MGTLDCTLTCTTYQGHVIDPSAMVLLKLVNLSNVVKDTDRITSGEQLDLYSDNKLLC